MAIKNSAFIGSDLNYVRHCFINFIKGWILLGLDIECQSLGVRLILQRLLTRQSSDTREFLSFKELEGSSTAR